jgi:hypothetical protein
MPEHCADLESDRALGARWEREFCKLAARKGRVFTPHQIGRNRSASAFSWEGKWRSLVLPDITIWTRPGEHHEIKHKSPTKDGRFGLEDYRIRALKWFSDETGQRVYYTIHNHNGNRDGTACRDDDWLTADINALWLAIERQDISPLRFHSYVNGQRQGVLGWLWPINLWAPLQALWARTTLA